MKQAMHTLCVFCGSSPGHHLVYREAAREVGRAIGRRGMRLVYGGGSVGMMGTLADAALEAGAEVIGVIPSVLVEREVAHGNLTRMEIVETMAERKQVMADLSDGFASLPGGIGTLDELFEMVTWAQIGFHRKPSAVLNVNGYFDSMLGFLDRAVDDGFLSSDHRRELIVADDVESLIEKLVTSQVTAPPKFAR